MTTLIVGNSPCRIPKILEVIKGSVGYLRFYWKWQEIAERMGVPESTIIQLKKDFNCGLITLEGVLCEILNIWKFNLGEGATLDLLCEVLTACSCKDVSDNLQAEFAIIWKARVIISSDVKVESQDEDRSKPSTTCLSSAGRSGNEADSIQFVNQLLEIPYEPTTTVVTSGHRILHDLIRETMQFGTAELEERVTLVLDMIRENPESLTSLNEDNIQPLLSENVHVELMDLLLYAGVDSNAVNDDGCNFVHVAAKCLPSNQFNQLVHYLVDHNLTNLLRVPDNEQQTPAFYVIWYNDNCDSSTINMLASVGMDFSAVDKYGASVLSDAVWRKRDVEILQVLVACGADVNWKSLKNGTLLHKAAWVGHVEAMKYLVGLGLDVNLANDDLYTPLMNTVRNRKMESNLEAVKFLLESNCNVNATDKYGNTPLSLAVGCNKSVEVLELLVAYGANWKWKDSDNTTLLHLAVYQGNLEAMKYLIMLGLEIKFLVENNAELNVTNQKGDSVISLALKFKQREAYDILITKGAK